MYMYMCINDMSYPMIQYKSPAPGQARGLAVQHRSLRPGAPEQYTGRSLIQGNDRTINII